MRSARTLGLALAVLAAGCATAKSVSTAEPAPPTREGAWAAARNGATRRAFVYDRFSHRATATATYLSAPVREAEVNRLAEWLGWTEQEKAARLQTELADAAKYDDFLLALYTGETKDNDLDARLGSVWRLALKLEGGDLVTKEATTLDPDATITGLFPFVGPFDVVYRVRFSKAPGEPLAGRKFVFEIASARGKMTLTYGDGTLGPDRIEGTPLPGR
jgi:hypothetical protein